MLLIRCPQSLFHTKSGMIEFQRRPASVVQPPYQTSLVEVPQIGTGPGLGLGRVDNDEMPEIKAFIHERHQDAAHELNKKLHTVRKVHARNTCS